MDANADRQVEETRQVELPRASLARALGKGIVDVYDRLGLVVAASFIWSVAVLIPVTVGLELQRRIPMRPPWLSIAGAAAAALIGGPILAGTFRMAYKAVYRDDPSLLDLFSGFRELLRSSLALVGVSAAAAAILAADSAFFFGIIGPLGRNWVFFAVGAACLYALLAWLMTAMYHLPALAAQRPMGQREGALAAIRKSLLLAAHNPGFTIGLFVVILGFTVLCTASVIGLPLLFAGTVSMVLTRALRELFLRYGIVEEPPEVVEDKGWRISRMRNGDGE